MPIMENNGKPTVTMTHSGSPYMLIVRTHARAYAVFSHRLALRFMFSLPKSSTDQCNEDFLKRGLLSPRGEDGQSGFSRSIQDHLGCIVTFNDNLNT